MNVDHPYRLAIRLQHEKLGDLLLRHQRQRFGRQLVGAGHLGIARHHVRGFAALETPRGMAADIAVFDPNTIIDRATYENPSLPPEGMQHVFVNGTLAFRNGAPTNAKPGRVMQRTPNMPSRATNIDLRRVSVKGEKGKSGHVVRIDLTQGAGRREASGTLTIDGVSYRPGFIQTTKSWATISAVDDQGRAALITIDMDRRSNAGTGMIVKIDGEEIWRSPGMLGVGSIQGI